MMKIIFLHLRCLARFCGQLNQVPRSRGTLVVCRLVDPYT